MDAGSIPAISTRRAPLTKRGLLVASHKNASSALSAVEGHIVYNDNMYFVYMIKNDFGKLYVGITENTTERLYYHNTKQGAQFTKGKAKFKIVFQEPHKTLPEARKREVQIKKWRRSKKEFLIQRFREGFPTT